VFWRAVRFGLQEEECHAISMRSAQPGRILRALCTGLLRRNTSQVGEEIVANATKQARKTAP
jgi:hypothetical protein